MDGQALRAFKPVMVVAVGIAFALVGCHGKRHEPPQTVAPIATASTSAEPGLPQSITGPFSRAHIHEHVFGPGEEVQVRVWMKAQASAVNGRCVDVVELMVPLAAIEKLPGKEASCLFGSAESSTLRFVEAPDGRLVLDYMEILVLVSSDFPPRGVGLVPCPALKQFLLPAETDPDTAGYKTLCSVQPHEGTPADALRIWAAVPANVASAVPRGLACWQLVRFLKGNSGVSTTPVVCDLP